MDLIVLSGEGSCGKTTTLNIVYDTLVPSVAGSTNKQRLGGNKDDFSDIIIWNGKRIAFFTMGDYSGALVQAVIDYVNQNCDLMICACNNRFVKPYNEFAKHPNNIINKLKETNSLLWHTTNNNAAQRILNLI